MTMASLNPFPDYAVTRLALDQNDGPITVLTGPIVKGRELVKKYISGIGAPVKAGQTNAALCAVRGDYGSGKTHLLNDVASQLKVACKISSSPSILRVTCIEADPLSWFKTKVGQLLDELPLYETALQLYSNAGKVVASATKLTESAVELLENDHTKIRNLIRANNLSVDEVSREFEKQLGIVCKDYDQTVRRVLSRLVSSETEGPARKWISGATLPMREAELLGVPATIDSADQVSSIIGAIAAMHKAVGHPFVLLIDELEHFTRYDEAHNSWGNITWLKRLLEELGNSGALALIAGHWSAWQTTKDYLDRFPQYAPIDLVRLEPLEVMEIVNRLLGTIPQGFDESHARVITAVTGGNMRRVMSLCNLLFRLTDGFRMELKERQIHEAWTSVAQRIPPQQALDQIVNLLKTRNFEVKLDKPFHAVPFDLVAERDDGCVILIQANHSNTQADHYDAARKFIDKLALVTISALRVSGIFLANGSIDDELLGLLHGGGIENLRWFDLTDRSAMEKIQTEISIIDERSRTRASGAAEPGMSHPRVESPNIVAMNAEFERRLRELDERRSRETQELKDRLEKQQNENNSSRYNAVLAETEPTFDRGRASYEAMLEKPTMYKKLRYLGKDMAIALASTTSGFFLVTTHESIGLFFQGARPYEIEMISFMMFLFGWLLPIAGLAWMWLRYSRVEDYFEFSRQTIQDLYLRDVPIQYLNSVNTTLRWAINRYGVDHAREAVIERLRSKSEAFPDIISSYFREISN